MLSVLLYIVSYTHYDYILLPKEKMHLYGPDYVMQSLRNGL